MDHRWKIPALLILCASIAATAASDSPIREAKWIAPDARLIALTTQPAACANLPDTTAERVSYNVGAIAFRTPLLLGGQAARAGLSCASCHANGRVTAGFHFPGLSGAPGTADVTSSIMSHSRGDATVNPKAIPDLAVDLPKISRDPASPALRAFIHGLIVEEFDGPDPAPAVLDGIDAYVRAQGGAKCDATGRTPISFRRDVDDLHVALDAAQALGAKGDAHAAWLMIAGGRAILGDLNSRFAGAALAKDRAEIVAADRMLQSLQMDTTAGRSPDYGRASRHIETVTDALSDAAGRSLYNPRRLAAALKR